MFQESGTHAQRKLQHHNMVQPCKEKVSELMKQDDNAENQQSDDNLQSLHLPLIQSLVSFSVSRI